MARNRHKIIHYKEYRKQTIKVVRTCEQMPEETWSNTTLNWEQRAKRTRGRPPLNWRINNVMKERGFWYRKLGTKFKTMLKTTNPQRSSRRRRSIGCCISIDIPGPGNEAELNGQPLINHLLCTLVDKVKSYKTTLYKKYLQLLLLSILSL